MEEIKKIEAAVGQEVSQWNVNSIATISEDKELITMLHVPGVLDLIMNTCTDEEVIQILYPVYIINKNKEAAELGTELLKKLDDEKINPLEVYNECVEIITNEKNNVFKRAYSYFILLGSFDDFDATPYTTDIVNVIKILADTIVKLVTEHNTELLVVFGTIKYLHSLIATLEVILYQKYSVVVFTEEEKQPIQEVLDFLDEFQQEALKTFTNSITPSEEHKNETDED